MKHIKKINELTTIYDLSSIKSTPIDIDDDVNISYLDLTELPCNFGVINGNFFCEGNKLTTMEGFPKRVEGDFNCSSTDGTVRNKVMRHKDGNSFLTLENAPEYVGGYFDCQGVGLTSLKGCPEYVKDHINIQYNNIHDFYDIGEYDNLYCNNNPIHEIYMLCPTKKFVKYLNEFRPIRSEYMTRYNFTQHQILGKRLEECLYMCDIEIDVSKLKFKNYTLLE